MLGGTEAGEEVNEDGEEVREPHVGTPLRKRSHQF